MTGKKFSELDSDTQIALRSAAGFNVLNDINSISAEFDEVGTTIDFTPSADTPLAGWSQVVFTSKANKKYILVPKTTDATGGQGVYALKIQDYIFTPSGGAAFTLQSRSYPSDQFVKGFVVYAPATDGSITLTSNSINLNALQAIVEKDTDSAIYNVVAHREIGTLNVFKIPQPGNTYRVIYKNAPNYVGLGAVYYYDETLTEITHTAVSGGNCNVIRTLSTYAYVGFPTISSSIADYVKLVSSDIDNNDDTKIDLFARAIPKKTMLITGESWISTGFSEYLPKLLNINIINNALGATGLAYDVKYFDRVYSSEALELADVILIQRAWDRDVNDGIGLEANYHDYEVDGVYDAVTYDSESQMFDYVLKRILDECYLLKDRTTSRFYGTTYGKTPIIVLATHWSRAYTTYNTSIRTLATKFGCVLLDFDSYIPCSLNAPIQSAGISTMDVYVNNSGSPYHPWTNIGYEALAAIAANQLGWIFNIGVSDDALISEWFNPDSIVSRLSINVTGLTFTITENGTYTLCDEDGVIVPKVYSYLDVPAYFYENVTLVRGGNSSTLDSADNYELLSGDTITFNFRIKTAWVDGTALLLKKYQLIVL